MIKIKTSNPLARELVGDLVSLLEDNGGFVHPNLELEIRGTELSLVHRKSLLQSEQVISIPVDVMPVLAEFTYALDGGKLVAQPIAGGIVTSVQRDAMALSVELYNLFDKVASYREVCPPLQLINNPELLAQLLRAAKAESYASQYFSSDEKLAIFCYWQTRAYHDVPSGTDRMLPFLEFVDHHAFADGFRPGFTAAAGDTLNLKHAKVAKGKVFACYAAFDAIECFVKYGFYDRTAFFVQLQPCSIELPGLGEVKLERRATNTYQLAEEDWLCQPQYTNSLFYTAQIVSEQGATPVLAYALIPPRKHAPAFVDAIGQQLAQLERRQGIAVGSLNNSSVRMAFIGALIRESKSQLRSLVRLAKGAEFDRSSPVGSNLMATLRHQHALIGEFENAVD